MKKIVLVFTLILSIAGSNFAKMHDQVKPDWVLTLGADGSMTILSDGDDCHLVAISEFADGSFDYTVYGLCDQNNPLFGVTYHYGVE